MPFPKSHQHRYHFLLGSRHKFRITGKHLSALTTATISETNPGVTWSQPTPADIVYNAGEDALYVTSMPSATALWSTAAAPSGDGSTTIVVINPPDGGGGGPVMPDQSPPVIPAFYSSTLLRP